MGAQQSAMQKLVNDISNDVTTTITNTTYNKSAVSCISSQNANIENHGSCVRVEIDQNAQNLCSLNSQFLTDNKSQISTTITDKVNNAIKQEQNIKQGFLAAGFANQISEQDVSNSISNVISNSVNSDTLNTCSAYSNLSQTATIKNYGSALVCKINQDSINQAVSNCFAKTANDSIVNNSVANTLDNTLSQSQKIVQEGIASALMALAALLLILVLSPIGLTMTNKYVAFVFGMMVIGALTYVPLSYYKNWPPFTPDDINKSCKGMDVQSQRGVVNEEITKIGQGMDTKSPTYRKDFCDKISASYSSATNDCQKGWYQWYASKSACDKIPGK